MKMYNILKTKYIKRWIALIIIFLIGGGLLIGFNIKGIAEYLEEPVDFYELSIDEMDGQYAKAKINISYGCFEEEYVKQYYVMKNTTGFYYCIPIGNDGQGGFEKFGAVRVNASLEDEMETITNDTYEIFAGNKVLTDSGIELKGIIKKMGSDEHKNLKTNLVDLGYTDAEAETMIAPYYLDTITNERTIPIILIVVGAILILIALFVFVYTVFGLNLGKVKRLIKDSGEEAYFDYTGAVQATKDIKVGKKYTYIENGMKPFILKNEDILWVYIRSVTRKSNGYKATSYIVNIADINGKIRKVNVADEMQGENVIDSLKEYEHIVFGYSDELAKMYKNNRIQFMTIRYNAAHNKAQSDMADDFFNDDTII